MTNSLLSGVKSVTQNLNLSNILLGVIDTRKGTYIFRFNTDVFTEFFHSFRAYNFIRTFNAKTTPD